MKKWSWKIDTSCVFNSWQCLEMLVGHNLARRGKAAWLIVIFFFHWIASEIPRHSNYLVWPHVEQRLHRWFLHSLNGSSLGHKETLQPAIWVSITSCITLGCILSSFYLLVNPEKFHLAAQDLHEWKRNQNLVHSSSQYGTQWKHFFTLLNKKCKILI